jgi:hypothetical protein
MSTAPRVLARRLAEWFFYPRSRPLAARNQVSQQSQ